ncbi:late competence development ComFB family protein [Thiomicrospira sp. R3]|uniref:late competence development ComFB family protein n=1 Tax=Thiomicrospira sp. R3 TaxID=3035472 RepID=UPI00259B0E2C|nr:late competence development ComFB family protein [Thiomicrospira sp. R3]WFE68389.1 late competence development ComFB family protein [Thiomicrospira sp. R3]
MYFDTVHNFYERHVINEITENYKNSGLDDEQLADMACIALNQIPPRYIRHDIDMSFYMSPVEYEEMGVRVKVAVKKAFNRIQTSDH